MKKRLSLQDKAELAMKAAVHKVIEHHEKTGRPLAVWENGRVRYISAAEVLRRRRIQSTSTEFAGWLANCD